HSRTTGRAGHGNDAATPRSIRTMQKKGYEFICPVEKSAPSGSLTSPTPNKETRIRRRALIATAAVAAVAASAAIYVATARRDPRPIVAVARFDNETGD